MFHGKCIEAVSYTTINYAFYYHKLDQLIDSTTIKMYIFIVQMFNKSAFCYGIGHRRIYNQPYSTLSYPHLALQFAM